MEAPHHYGWMLVILIIFAGSVYVFMLTRPDTYKPGSVHTEQQRQDLPFSIHIGEGSCSTIGRDKTFTKK